LRCEPPDARLIGEIIRRLALGIGKALVVIGVAAAIAVLAVRNYLAGVDSIIC